jgi:acetyl esterase/lipase
MLLFVACGNNTTSTDTVSDSSNAATNHDSSSASLKPKVNAPAWAPDIKNEMLVVIEKLESYNDKPTETLTAQEARMQHTPTDAVIDVINEYKIPVPPSQVDTMGKEIPVHGGNIHARIYIPKTADAILPVIVYYHGGGWVIADLNTYDASAKGLAEQTGAVVVSVHYRQGPEHMFPTAHNDAFAAYQWVLQNAALLKVNPKLIAVAGESAGGNLACNVSIMARARGIQMPLHQLLVYPVAGSDMNSESYNKFAQAKPLNKPMMAWFVKNYLGDPAKAIDPRISLVKANLKGLPPTTIVAAEIDPLQTEGKLLYDNLKKAGVDVDYKLYKGVTHEFFGMAAVVPEAKDAQGYASGRIKNAFKG